MAVTEAPPAAGLSVRSETRAPRVPGFLRRDAVAFGALLAAAAIYYLAPGTLLSVTGALVFALLAAVRTDLALAVVVAALPFYYHPRAWGSLQFAPAETFLLATTAGAAVSLIPAARRRLTAGRSSFSPASLLETGQRLLGPSFAAPLVLFALAAILSLVLPPLVEPRVAVREFRTVIVEPLIFYLLVLRFVRTRRQVEWLLGALVVSAALVGRFGIEQYLLNRGAWEMDGVRRVSSYYPSATALGLYLGRVFPVAAALAFFLPTGPRRVGYALLCLPIAAGVFLSWTRAAWLGDFAAIGIIVLLVGRRRVIAAFLAVSAAALAGLLVTRPERIVALFSAGEGTHISRLPIWQSAVNVLRERPLTGAGLDQFVHLDPERYGIPHIRFMLFSHPHNLILDFWLRLGLLGIVALTWLLVRFYRVSYSLYRRAPDTFTVALALGLIGSMTHFIVHGLFDLTYFQSDLAFLFWLSLALIEVARRWLPTGPVAPATTNPTV